MKFRAIAAIAFFGIFLFAALGVLGEKSGYEMPRLLAGDADGDGVPDSIDACPLEDASFFDRDGNGCIDDVTGARHIEYWGIDDTVTYYIQLDGAPNVSDGSDFTAIHDGMDAWPTITGIDIIVSYGGTIAQEDAAALDQLNLITFKDDQFNFPSAVLAVGIATSFMVDSLYNGKLFRPGQIVDADMIFNPAKMFKTPSSGGFGRDIQSIATHEAGHLYGISHSAVTTSTMFFVLSPGTNASSLEAEDASIFLKAYPDSLTLADGNRLGGTVTSGASLPAAEPVPGAAVFIIDAISGDTTGCDYTLPDGSYEFVGLPDGDYHVAIHPLNGTSSIGYLLGGYINALVDTTAETVFVPEFWDLAESSTDDPSAKDAVTLSGGGSELNVDIITNVDNTPPEVVGINPANNETNVRIDAAVLISFSEAIAVSTLSGNFALTDSATGAFISGNAAVLNDDSLVAFTPSQPLEFSTAYELNLQTGLQDKFGNGLAAPYYMKFRTEPMPPLSISNLVPNKGVAGSVIVINGAGFDYNPSANIVTFAGESGGVAAVVTEAAPGRLVVEVPQDAVTGQVTVQVGPDTDAGPTFTLLPAIEVARGTEIGSAALGSLPRSVTILPDGGHAYAATQAGAASVVLDPGLAGYLTSTAIPIAAGLDELDATPGGKRVYGISRSDSSVYVIGSDPGEGLLFNQVINSIPVGDEPLGIVIEPTGRRAFIPTSGGDIRILDVLQGSSTFWNQIGVITSPDPNLRGKMAVDPAGNRLLALTGTGKLLVFDLGPDTLAAEITVGFDPRDVVVDPAGQRAYVSDASGNIAVVSLSGLFKVQDISTGGSLRGIAITPAGFYLYAANRELDKLDVADLTEGNATYRSVAANISQGTNPVDVDLSPDGFYAYSLVESDQALVATNIGFGPTLRSLSQGAGPVGTKLVLAGDGFGGIPSLIHINFESSTGVPVAVLPDQASDASLTVEVPANAISGLVSVTVFPSDVTDPGTTSNPLYFHVIDVSVSTGELRLANAVGYPQENFRFSDALTFSPTGDFVAIAGYEGELTILDTDPGSPSFNQFIMTVDLALEEIDDIAVTPNGQRAFVVSHENPPVPIVNVNRYSSEFGAILGYVDFDSLTLGHLLRVEISPDGKLCLISDRAMNNVHIVDLQPGSPTENKVIATVSAGYIKDMVFHPEGLYAYLGDRSGDVHVLDLDPLSTYYQSIITTVPMLGSPRESAVSLSFTSDGSRCLVLTEQIVSTPHNRSIVSLDTSNPASPSISDYQPYGATSGVGRDVIDVSPKGDRALFHIRRSGFYYLDLTSEPDSLISHSFFLGTHAHLDLDYSPDASHVYAVSTDMDSILIFDFKEAQSINLLSGNGQTGIINQVLPAPLKVSVSDGSGYPLADVAVMFKVTGGGGIFEGTGTSTQVVATDANGIAEVQLRLGSVIGPMTHMVAASAEGLLGSPVQFAASAMNNPSILPLTLSEILPLDGSANVSVTTAILTAFSRSVDPSSVDNTRLYIHKNGESSALPAIVGFADANKKVSLTPVAPLEFGMTYVVEVAAGILDADGGALQNPDSSIFSTQSPPQLVLTSVNPPSAAANVVLVLSGTGFDSSPANNTVFFNDKPATPFEAGVDYLKVNVPSDAVTGLVKVQVGSSISNTLPFTVLVPNDSPIDSVIASVSTGAATKSVVLTPDGARAYTVSPEGGIVVPIEISSQTTMQSIAVGDHPISIAMHPDGSFAYVANFNSGSISVIDVDSSSTTFNDVLATLLVGTNPIDLIVSPDGNRVIVANAGSNTLSIIDSDENSATHLQIIASVGTGSAAKSVTMTPDGSRIYIGTDMGFIVMNSSDYGIIASVGTGSAAKSVTMTPDGSLLIILTTSGEVLIVDVEPGSSTENTIIASVGKGSSTKSVTMTPDGSLLYLIQEESDLIIVVSLEVLESISVLGEGVEYPPSRVRIAVVDSFTTGDDPAAIAFDPSGSGLAIVTNAGDQTVSFVNTSAVPSGPLAADILVTPRALHLDSRGRWVIGSVELHPSYSPEEIDINSVLLQDTIPAELDKWEILDEDQDGIQELLVRFDRVPFQAVMPQGEYVPVKISGIVRNREFFGSGTIKTIRPIVTHPSGGVVPTGVPINVSWTSPGEFEVDYVDVHWTHNDGSTWLPIAIGIPDTGFVRWETPQEPQDSCRVMVTIYSGEEDVGMGMSQDMFLLLGDVAVTIKSFNGKVEANAAVLRWSTAQEAYIKGFHLLRSEREDAGYQRITPEMIPARGRTGGSWYAFRDSTIRLNQAYYYKLEQISERGSEGFTGPYKVVFLGALSLEQNVPNPFNPKTTISFTLPEKMRVKLSIFNVRGRLVKTLLDKTLTEGFKKAIWDGRDARGNPVGSGVYFYRLQAGKKVLAKKMVLLK